MGETVTQLRKRRRELERKQDELRKDYASGGLDYGTYENRKRDLRNRIAEVRKEIQEENENAKQRRQ